MDNSMSLKKFIHKYSFATLITYVDEIHVSHLNFILDEHDDTYLYGHLALSNQQSADFVHNPKTIVVFSKDMHESYGDEFAYFIHGNVEVIHDLEKKQEILDKLVSGYENHQPTSWTVDWQDTRYQRLINAVIFIAIKINAVDVQLTSELQWETQPLEDNLFSSCATIANGESTRNQNIVYIPEHFYEKNQKCLLECIKYQRVPLAILYNQDDLLVRYVTLSYHEEMIKFLITSNQLLNNETNTFMIFKGPHCYVSPRFYRSEVNVPTWNYSIVYVQGVAKSSQHNDNMEIMMQFEPHQIFGKFKLSQNRTAEDRGSVCDNLSVSTNRSDIETASCMHRIGIR